MADPWFVQAFGAAYLDVYAHRDEESAAREVAFAARALGSACGSVSNSAGLPNAAGNSACGPRVLDAGCGAGRHARALDRGGARVVGLDLSADLLAVAVRAGRPSSKTLNSKSASVQDASAEDASAQDAGGAVCGAISGPVYVRGDLRALPFGSATFDGVASFFTAFGYFDDAGNLAQLREFRRVLRSRGRLVLDFLNAELVRATLVPTSDRVVGDRRIMETRRIVAGRVEKRVRVVRTEGADLEWTESVRLYDARELSRLLESAGLPTVSLHGDLEGAAFEAASSPRCVAVAEAA